MRPDLDVYGVFVPSLLLALLITYALSHLLSRLLRRMRLYRFVWHPALFDFAIFVCVLGGVVFVSSELLS
mgnify:CR=1 FL=1